MSERRGYRVEDRRRVIPLEYRVNRDTSINPNTWRHKRENIPSMINDRPETKAWNILKNFLPTGGNVGRHVGNYLVDRFNLGYGGDNGSSGIVNSGRDNNIFQDYKNFIDTNFDFDFGNKEASWIPELWGGRARVGAGPNNLFVGWGKKF